VKEWGGTLEHADDSLKADREVVLASVYQDGSLEYADDTLKADRDFLLAAAKAGSKFATMYADDSLMDDPEFLLKLFQHQR